MSDGKSLTSIVHPVAPWYSRVVRWIWYRDIRGASLEEIEIDLDKLRNGKLIIPSKKD